MRIRVTDRVKKGINLIDLYKEDREKNKLAL